MALTQHNVFSMTVGTTAWALASSALVGEAFKNMSVGTKEALHQTFHDENVLLRDADTQEHHVSPPPQRGACYYAGFCLCWKPWLRRYLCLLQSVCRRQFKKGTELQQII